jgi:hypothetical protein
VAYNVKKVLSLNHSLDNIIESEYKKAFESLDKYGIIEYIKRKYKINYKKPELEILEDQPSITAAYSPNKNKIIFSKKSIERMIDSQSLNIPYNSIFLYPLYINEKNERKMRKAIAESIIRSAMFHEIWHSIDYSILHKLDKDSTIKDRDYLLTILNNRDNRELRATAFEVVMYYLDLVNNLHKHKKGYITAYFNIPICRNYIEKIAKLEKDEDMNKYVSHDLGFCYGNVIVAANKSSLKENIYNIIEDIVHLNKERAIDVIRRYVYNLDRLSHD